MSESNTISRPEFLAYHSVVDGQFYGGRKAISDLKDMARKLATTRAVVNGGLTILGSVLGSVPLNIKPGETPCS